MLDLLVVAPTCDGNDVGEAWVAHQWVSHLARRHDVTLLTYAKRGAQPASEQITGLRVVEWREPPLVGRAERLNSMLKPGYVPFHVRARHWIRAELARGRRFDIVHQPAPVAMRYPCPAIGLGMPVVIGPVGGGLDSPPAFAADEDSTPWFVGLRALDGFRMRHDRLLRRTYESADCVVGIAPYVESNLSGLRVRRFTTMSETALTELPATRVRSERPDQPVTLLHVGRLVRTKGARDTIRAMVALRDLPVRLEIVGDGPDRAACEALVSELRLGDRVTFHGRLPRDQVEQWYERADVFVFPSYREPGGNVAFEAMGHGLPLVVCDRGGPGNVVDDSCGVRVAAVTPDQLAADVAAAVAKLVGDPERRLAMGRAAREVVAAQHLWERRVDQIDEVFDQVLGARSGGSR